MLTTSELFNLKQVAPFLQPLLTDEMPWRVLKHLDSFLESISDERFGQIHSTAWVIGSVYLDASARIGPHALIEGPAWIGPGAEVGHSAYLRGGVVMAQGSKVGHSSEVKHSILLSGAKLPHCNYVGDSIVGHNVNLGAGVKVANFNTFDGTIQVGEQDTHLHKFGGAIGDDVSIGCNAVIAPGTLIGPRSLVYSGVIVNGIYSADSVIKHIPVQDVTARHRSHHPG
ncbi:MAG TPA: hypothetical protein V6D48_02320 [Oculatellaceae cyanobacterium]